MAICPALMGVLPWAWAVNVAAISWAHHWAARWVSVSLLSAAGSWLSHVRRRGAVPLGSLLSLRAAWAGM